MHRRTQALIERWSSTGSSQQHGRLSLEPQQCRPAINQASTMASSYSELFRQRKGWAGPPEEYAQDTFPG